jgi:hypothetical protein
MARKRAAVRPATAGPGRLPPPSHRPTPRATKAYPRPPPARRIAHGPRRPLPPPRRTAQSPARASRPACRRRPRPSTSRTPARRRTSPSWTGRGNAVALTQTNSSTFGSGAWVSGFFLNDSGARVPEERMAGGSAAWRTPTSTIAPTIVLEDGRVRLVTGAPGAGRIPTEITQTMLYVLDYGMDLVDALRMPRVFPPPRPCGPTQARVQAPNCWRRSGTSATRRCLRPLIMRVCT